MKPFKFKLQALETLRERELENSMQRHAVKLAERSAAATSVLAGEKELEENTICWRDALKRGLSAHEFLQYEAAGTVLKSRLARQRMELGRAEEAVAASLVQLRLDQQKVDSLAKLRERHQQSHQFKEAAQEQRFLDDIAGRVDTQAELHNLNNNG